ncbi:MAG: hypothetical protein EBY09_06905 [Verrucomicrobia bacterium]|nr:hypothetical protein [Verrucomicrobiota bacterium]NBU09891.1 hypothetical protein [Pseudomonadota bacterium]NDA66353.1 hypothetical protein [Verrucomicrobiota bacterium]NDD37093.1 hypothetical protein [Verrucomicrobiota bacterium]NDE96935.1 hypothetical protein [Verrucomicrobiota bacterium]
MKLNNVNQYVALREALVKEKAKLEARLAEINRALGGRASEAGTSGPKPGPKAGSRRGKRAKNELSMKEAAVKALAAKPLSRTELLDAVLKLGYKFTASNPLNSLSTLLYSDKSFKNSNGKFSVGK